MKLAHLSATALAFLLALGTGTAAVENASVIGMTSGLTGATLDNSKVGSGATLFDGSTVQTTSIGDGSYTRIHLNDGTRLELGAASKARVFAKRATLEIGTSEFQSGSGYEIDTQLLKIQPTGASSVATVRVEAGNKVYVTALNAPVNVLNRDGMLVARVNPGLPLSFLPQAGATASFDDTGCVLQKSGAAIFSPSSGNIVSELRGADLRKAVGNTTHVMGSVDAAATPAGGATQVIHVTGFTVTKKGGCSDKAAALGATTAAAGLGAAATAGAVGAAAGAGAAAVGISTTAIVVGSVAAATAVGVGAAAATGAFSSSSP